MIEKIKIFPFEFWAGAFALGAYFAKQDNTLLIMSVVLLTASKILFEVREK